MTVDELLKSTQPISIEKKVLLNIMFTHNLITEKFNEVLKPFDLSTEQYNVLRILRGQKDKPANMSTLQERMIAKTSNTTRLVDKLLAKQLVTRETCCSNRRKMEIAITPKGLEILAKLDPIVIQNETNFAEKLTLKELEQLNNLLDKYRN